jgi:hypothetical protein
VTTQKDAPAKTPAHPEEGRPPEELPYVIELWFADHTAAVERVLARALDARLAREIFKAASSEYPERRITLQKGGRVVADTAEQVPSAGR